MTNFKTGKDKVETVKALGNIPENIGFDPFLAWRTICSRCGLEGNIFEDHIKILRISKNVMVRGKRVRRCKGCRADWQKVLRRMDRARAFHLNDIRFRGTNMNEDQAFNE